MTYGPALLWMRVTNGGPLFTLVMKNKTWRNLSSKMIGQNNASGSAHSALSLQLEENDGSSLFMWTKTSTSPYLRHKSAFFEWAEHCPSGPGTRLKALLILLHLILPQTLWSTTPGVSDKRTIVPLPRLDNQEEEEMEFKFHALSPQPFSFPPLWGPNPSA